jgi:hypothetical protein
MPQYVRLCEDGRISRRAMADAIEVLHENASFGAHDRAEICIGLLKLPSAAVVGLVQIVFDPKIGDKAYVVSLPTSKQFKAYRPNAPQRDLFNIEQLHRAVLDGTGTVLLHNGVTLHAVEVIPAHLPLEPTELDWRIIHQTLSIIKAGHCYRSWASGLPLHVQDMMAELRMVDCSTFAGLTLPRLKVVSSLIRESDPVLKMLSAQQVADTLRKFGIRIPLPRPRRRHGLTTI